MKIGPYWLGEEGAEMAGLLLDLLYSINYFKLF